MSNQTSRTDAPAGTQPEGTDEVGYCRPPKHSQYKPGQSGNRKGRPKGSRNLRSELRKDLAELLPIIVGGKRRRVPALVAVQRVQLQQALKNDHRAALLMFKNAKEFGALDQPEALDQHERTEECTSLGMSNEFIRRLSDKGLAEIIRICEELLAEKNAEMAALASEVSAPARPRNPAVLGELCEGEIARRGR
jgi:hypothetical protein